MKHRLNHLKTSYGFDPLKAELEVLSQTHLALSLSGCKAPQHERLAAERAARFHKLLTHCSHQEHINYAGRYDCWLCVIFECIRDLSVWCPHTKTIRTVWPVPGGRHVDLFLTSWSWNDPWRVLVLVKAWKVLVSSVFFCYHFSSIVYWLLVGWLLWWIATKQITVLKFCMVGDWFVSCFF